MLLRKIIMKMVNFLINIWNNIEQITKNVLSLIVLFYIFNFLTSSFFWRKKHSKSSIKKVQFSQIGGLYEAKEELKEIVDYFKNPFLFIKKGVKLPRGIMLVGPPGNGKTLLAKAFSNESGMPFIFRSASEFEEKFVGVGSMRVRKFFDRARSYPNGCIIFIDEIDSIGTKRYSSLNYSNSQTLNQLLSEMDGLSSNDNIFVLAATNNIDVLDHALLRPGRFDRKIYVSNPNFNSRKEIIKLSVFNKPFEKTIDVDEIAYMTEGFSGSEIVSVINESLILSIRENIDLVNQALILEGIDRVLMGPSLKSFVPSDKNRIITSYHEAGHAVVALSLPETTVRKITITARWKSGGYTLVDLYKMNKGDDYNISKNQILSNIMSSMGGRISEEIIFGTNEITSGAYSDLKKINNLLDKLFFDYSMSEVGIIPIDYSKKILESNSAVSKNFSDKYLSRIELERERIIRKCQNKVKKILKDKKNILDLFANVLLKKNVILKDDIIYIFVNKISPYLRLLN